MKRCILLLALLAGNALAQYTPPAREVRALAPQLEAFGGSKGNFESLVSGLHGGTTVRLASLTADGMREVVTFTAAEALPADGIARVLENARFHLLDLGIREPGGWDIALVLMGRMELKPAGPVFQPGLLSPADAQKPLALSLHSFAGSRANYASLVRGLTEGRTVTLTDPADRRSRARFEPQCALPAQECRPALLEVAEGLAADGVGDPTIQELRAAVVRMLAARCSAVQSSRN